MIKARIVEDPSPEEMKRQDAFIEQLRDKIVALCSGEVVAHGGVDAMKLIGMFSDLTATAILHLPESAQGNAFGQATEDIAKKLGILSIALEIPVPKPPLNS